MKNLLTKIKTHFRYFLVPDSWKQLKRCDVLLVCHDADRGYKFEGKTYSHLVDSLKEILEANSISTQNVSSPYTVQSFNHTFYPYYSFNRKILVNSFKIKIKDLFSLDQTNPGMALKTAWGDILNRTSPKAVIAIQPDVTLSMACHERGIKVYDFQHGVINHSMIFYGHEYKKNSSQDSVPTGFFCWNDSSAEVINSWGLKLGISSYVVGNPWLDRFSKLLPEDKLVQNEVSELESLKSSKISILVSLQWGLNYFYPEFFQDEEMIHPELLKLMKEQNHITWNLRLHPIMISHGPSLNYLKNLCQEFPHISYESPSKMALPALLTLMDAHITWDSSCVIEARLYNIKSFVMNPSYFATMDKIGNHKNKTEDMPFLKEEREGFVTRTIQHPSLIEILSWIKMTSKKDLNSKKSLELFDTEKFLDILNIGKKV